MIICLAGFFISQLIIIDNSDSWLRYLFRKYLLLIKLFVHKKNTRNMLTKDKFLLQKLVKMNLFLTEYVSS